MKILIIDNDKISAELESDYLKLEGFDCEISSDAGNGLELALKKEYALVIAEVNLSDMDGFSLCKEFRLSKDIPFIFVSSRIGEVDKIRGLRAGADDYITKPFSPSEFVERVKAHIKRYERLVLKNFGGKANIVSMRNLEIDKNARRIFVDGSEVSMPVKEYELLVFFAENPNIVFSKERLFDRIWGMDAMGDVSTVTVHIQRLREKIDKNRSGVKHIETVWSAGYRFIP